MLAVLLAVPAPSGVGAEPAPAAEDEQTLKTAGLATDGPALLAFFHARARTEVDNERLRVLLTQFASASNQERSLATAEFLGLGPHAVPTLRRAANNLETPKVAARAQRCLEWIEGSSSAALPAAAARVLALRKPAGSAGALLAYLPFADNPEVAVAVTAALAAVAAPGGKPDPVLVRGLADPMAVRRAAAGTALVRAVPPDRVPDVRKLLTDPAPGVRLRTAMALGEARDAEAIPVLIQLLGELPLAQRKPIEDLLQQLAGEWAPAANFPGEDEIARKIRRDAWAMWWQNVDGESLQAAIRRRTLTAEDREKIRGLLGKLSSEDFATREVAASELFALGRRSLPQLRESLKNTDPEVARRAKGLIERIELDPTHHLPAAAVRLLAVRKPAGSVNTLLAYLPYAEDETMGDEVTRSLATLALRDGKPDESLVRALDDKQPRMRTAAAEALISGAGMQGRNVVRKLLADKVPDVRMRVGLAMALARERDGIPVLIDLLTVLPAEDVGRVEEALHQLAGDTAPNVAPGEKPEERKKCRDAWAAWWKVNDKRVDLARLTARPFLGYTLIVDMGGNRVFELDRHGKERWSIPAAGGPADAVVIPGNRVLIAEYGIDRITERDFKGTIIWQKRIANPVNIQRLANGNIFVATFNGPIFEMDRTGKEIHTYNVPGGVLAAYRSRRGHIVCVTRTGQCSIMDASGKELKSFACGQSNSFGGLDVLPNDRILVMQGNRGKATEFDMEGKTILEVDAQNGSTATGLPNGHILIASQNTRRLWEVDRAGKVVWEYKGGPGQFFRGRRR
jgi:HEAT repeat protein